ncbi:MAG: LysR substrate-binding domain-containing protein [bacterium]
MMSHGRSRLPALLPRGRRAAQLRAAAERCTCRPPPSATASAGSKKTWTVRLFDRTHRRVEPGRGRRLRPQAERPGRGCGVSGGGPRRRHPPALRADAWHPLRAGPELAADRARPPPGAPPRPPPQPELRRRTGSADAGGARRSGRRRHQHPPHPRRARLRAAARGAVRLLRCAALLDVLPSIADDARRHTLLDAFADLPLFRYLLDARPAADAWGFRGTELLGTIAAIRARALAGKGVAVLPAYFVAADLAAGRLRAVLPDHPLQQDWFRLIWRRGHPLADELRALAEELRGFPLR